MGGGFGNPPRATRERRHHKVARFGLANPNPLAQGGGFANPPRALWKGRGICQFHESDI